MEIEREKLWLHARNLHNTHLHIHNTYRSPKSTSATFACFFPSILLCIINLAISKMNNECAIFLVQEWGERVTLLFYSFLLLSPTFDRTQIETVRRANNKREEANSSKGEDQKGFVRKHEKSQFTFVYCS